MRKYLEKLLIEKYGHCDISKIPYKDIDETTERDQIDTRLCRDWKLATGRFITPKEMKEWKAKVLLKPLP